MKCTASQKVARGCESNAPIPTVTIDGEGQFRCPRRPILEDPQTYFDVFEAYRWYRQGQWPDEGTYLDQAAPLREIFAVLDKVTRDLEKQKENQRSRRGPQR